MQADAVDKHVHGHVASSTGWTRTSSRWAASADDDSAFASASRLGAASLRVGGTLIVSVDTLAQQ